MTMDAPFLHLDLTPDDRENIETIRTHAQLHPRVTDASIARFALHYTANLLRPVCLTLDKDDPLLKHLPKHED